MIVLKITLNFNVYSNLPVATDCTSSLRDLKRDVVPILKQLTNIFLLAALRSEHYVVRIIA